MSPWRRLDVNARGFELDPRQPQHLGRAVDADRLGCARAEQLDHPAGAGADVDQAAERPFAKRAVDRPLDLALGDMERADLVPHLGMAGEIAVGGLGALGADGFGARRVGGEQRLRRGVGPVRRSSANSGSTRSRSASVRNTQLPSLRRSSTPASARILRWRDTRGWLCPSTWASSPTDNSISRSSATMRSRVGSASAWNRSASGSVCGHEIRI